MTFARISSAALVLVSAVSFALPAKAPAASPNATWGSFGIDVAGLDPSVRPGDDFWSYVNGRWARTVRIPADSGSVGQVSRLNQLAASQVRGILEGLVRQKRTMAPDDRRIADYYASLMDQKAIDARGAAPLVAELRGVRQAPTHSALAAQMGRFASEWEDTAWLGRMPRYFPSLFRISIEQDGKNNDRYVPYIGQSGLGMPSRDFYLKQDAASKRVQRAYRKHVAAMLRLIGVPEGETSRRSDAVYRFERAVAAAQWSLAETRDPDKFENGLSLRQLQSAAPDFDWKSYLEPLGLQKRSDFVLAQPSTIGPMARLFVKTPLVVLKDWLSVMVAKDRALVLPRAFAREEFAFSLQTLGGATAGPPRWSEAVELTATAMPDAVSRPYVERYFPPETKKAIDDLVRNILAAMDRRLANLSWMEPETRVKARAKLAAFRPMIGYPDKWRSFSGLRVVKGDAYGNFVRAGRYEYERNLHRIDDPVDRDEWFMMPIIANAYSNAANNQIVFSAAYLQPPHFDPKADPAVNYGAIGSVIGHEISHQFDDEGSKFDPHGRLVKWWTDQDLARFKERVARLARQYDSYEALPGLHIRGDQTLGENIADLTGLAIAYDAYQLSLGGKPAPVIGGLTGDQRFFIGRTQVYRTTAREEELRRFVLSDMHAPSKWRAWTVRNNDAWYRAFGVKPGDKMYLAPEERVKIWE